VDDDGNPIKYHVGSGLVEVAAQPVASITVISPNGGENWEQGTVESITWNSTNGGDFVKIEIYNQGSYYAEISSKTENDGIYNWLIPVHYTESSSFEIRITEFKNSSVNDSSDNDFTIRDEPQPEITVLIPRSGTNWRMGSTYTIRWSSTTIGDLVDIELYRSGLYIGMIETNVTNDGSFPWTIPTTLIASDQYMIKVVSKGSRIIIGESATFTLY